ncbi:AAA family ATPase [Herbiconiux liukaitaii]|uniref:AAA family ATPase n=1 Tax=Herbiconiux liukaitaii TaxID=3342799 RepID=UPI0035B93855
MKFRVPDDGRTGTELDTVYISPTGWDDWFKYSTLFYAEYRDRTGNIQPIGTTKIGKVGLLPARASEPSVDGKRIPRPPARFSKLDASFFSLGQDPEFYEALTTIGDEFREEFLKAIRDIAYNPDILAAVEGEDVTRVSLLRGVPLPTVRDQFNRLAHGGAKLTAFNLGFKLGYTRSEPVPSIRFAVTPGLVPPTNIHVIIGRNGVGKSTLLNKIASHLVKQGSKRDQESDVDSSTSADITNLVSISFSAFDSFEPLSVPQDRSGLTYHYVGLKKRRTRSDEPDAIKGPRALASEMTSSSRLCFEGARRARWLQGLRLLEADPIFAALGIADVVESAKTIDEALEHVGPSFRLLSSGHKIVLLTITKLVETVEEKSLVLLDEPEAHLHPPLLSAFIRALSDLLINRNGVAVIATHSPVVLQEVPRVCAWKIDRVLGQTSVKPPQIETFGENVGTLTNEVFGLEVAATGFHRILWEAAQEERDYDLALARLGGQVGTEGRAILRAMTNALGTVNVGS